MLGCPPLSLKIENMAGCSAVNNTVNNTPAGGNAVENDADDGPACSISVGKVFKKVDRFLLVRVVDIDHEEAADITADIFLRQWTTIRTPEKEISSTLLI